MAGSFIFKFKKEPGAKAEPDNFIRVPSFADKTAQLGSYDFVLNGDASALDISDAGDLLKYMRFSNETIFPSKDKMPDGFEPDKVLESGKAPGLHIGDLHDAGITGKGITVAIIDQALNTEHVEIKDNIVHYESIGYNKDKLADLHGTAVSSLLAGKTLGVAPDVNIVYFAANNLKDVSDKLFDEPEIQTAILKCLPENVKYDDFIAGVKNKKYETDKTFQQLLRGVMRQLPLEIVKRIENAKREICFENYAEALRRILFMNSRLPKDKKISAVSISWGMLHEDPESTKLIKMLIESGVMVLTTDSYRFYGDKAAFTTIDRKTNSDPDNIESYDAGFWRKYSEQPENTLLVPAGGRTIAGYYDDTQYIYSGANAGMSWATPYLVGVYALAKQVMPTLTPEHFFAVAHQVGASNEKLGNNVVIQPQRIIEYLQNENLLQKQNLEAKGR